MNETVRVWGICGMILTVQTDVMAGKVSQSQFVYLNRHTEWPVTEPWPPR